MQNPSVRAGFFEPIPFFLVLAAFGGKTRLTCGVYERRHRFEPTLAAGLDRGQSLLERGPLLGELVLEGAVLVEG
jgi:hypothetical protein